MHALSTRHDPKYYLYHRDHGHDTKECIQLQDEIEELIRHGHLDKYLKDQLERDETQLEQPQLERNLIIDMSQIS